MAIPNIDTLTAADLQVLMAAIAQRQAALAVAEQQSVESLAGDIHTSITTLNNLIGPDNPTKPGTETITEVRMFTPAKMAGAPQVALPLAFHALEILAKATRDIAEYVARDSM